MNHFFLCKSKARKINKLSPDFHVGDFLQIMTTPKLNLSMQHLCRNVVFRLPVNELFDAVLVNIRKLTLFILKHHGVVLDEMQYM